MTPDLAAGLLRPHALHDQILSFTRAMVDSGGLPDADIMVDFLEKPWKWGPEYSAWVNAGEPLEGDKTWDEWCDELAKVQTS